MSALPNFPRVTLDEVAAYMRLSKDTIRSRIKKGSFPKPIDKGRRVIFDREEVLAATQPEQRDHSQEVEDALIRAAEKVSRKRTRGKSKMAPEKRRKRKSLVRSAEPAIRLVADNTGL